MQPSRMNRQTPPANHSNHPSSCSKGFIEDMYSAKWTKVTMVGSSSEEHSPGSPTFQNPYSVPANDPFGDHHISAGLDHLSEEETWFDSGAKTGSEIVGEEDINMSLLSIQAKETTTTLLNNPANSQHDLDNHPSYCAVGSTYPLLEQDDIYGRASQPSSIQHASLPIRSVPFNQGQPVMDATASMYHPIFHHPENFQPPSDNFSPTPQPNPAAVNSNTLHPSHDQQYPALGANPSSTNTSIPANAVQPPNTFLCQEPLCGKIFSRITDLVRHNNSVHRLIKYNCTERFCHNNHNKGFSRPDKLLKHKREAHGLNI